MSDIIHDLEMHSSERSFYGNLKHTKKNGEEGDNARSCHATIESENTLGSTSGLIGLYFALGIEPGTVYR